MVEIYIRVVLFSLVFISDSSLFGQSSSDKTGKLSLFDLIAEQSGLEVELRTQIDSLALMKLKPFVSQGTIFFKTDSLEIELPLKVNVRGKYRRRTCDFPPLLLNFPKGELGDLGLKKSDQYKLVTHCLKDKESQNYLFREYLVYQLYRAIEPSGFRAIVFPIKYIDSDNRNSQKNYAMLLESNDELKDRLGGKWCDCLGLEPDSINDYYRELVIFFQYMIGNKDMNLQIEHNVRFLEGKKHNKKIPIPYDFDFSAFVRAPYAFSDQTVTFDRSPLVVGKNQEAFEKVLSLFKDHKQDFFEIIANFRLLSKRHRNRCHKFMEDFFRLIEKPNFSEKYLK